MGTVTRMELRKIDELHPYEHNAKLHPPEQIEKLRRSFREFGMIVPVGIDSQDRVIYGHGRLLAAQAEGWTEVPTVTVEDLSEDQRRAFVHADNLLSETGYDKDTLRSEAQALQAAGFDVTLVGFEAGGIKLDAVKAKISTDNEDDAPETPAEPITQRGDLWQLGDHILMCGNATSADDVQVCAGGGQVPLVLTDPPYGVSIVSGKSIGGNEPATFKGKIGSSNVCEVNKYSPVIGDESAEAARLSYEILKPTAKNFVLFGGNYFSDFLPPSPCWIVWDKQNGECNFADVELAWTSFDRHARLYQWMWNGMSRKGDRMSEGVRRVHPTQKPVGLLRMILADFSSSGDVILDPFGGSGTTLIACEQLGRKCRMMELDPGYCDVIVSRWEQFTGKKAVRLDG